MIKSESVIERFPAGSKSCELVATIMDEPLNASKNQVTHYLAVRPLAIVDMQVRKVNGGCMHPFSSLCCLISAE